MVNDFIFELGCEELPSGAVWPLANELAQHMKSLLDKAQLSYKEIKPFATPRRLAFVIFDLQSQQNSQTVIKRGPAFASAFDSEGKPQPALLGFARSCGIDYDQLTKLQTDKGEWMVYEEYCPGKTVQELLPSMVSQSLTALSIAKPMRWGEGNDEFARPVHWSVMLYGDEVLTHTLLGVQTGRLSRGHRFHSPGVVAIECAKRYEAQMKECFVIADFATRKTLIKEQVEQLAKQHHAIVVMPEELLDEVTSIVEWPQALIARFEPEFLEVPSEALIASMQSHQKCFALKDTDEKLLPYFITVSNIASTNPSQVIAGNEKVMRARLSDAAFFFRMDKKQALHHRIQSTEQVVFQVKLGSLFEKTQRMKALMPHLSTALDLSLQQAERAAELSKCDLMTGMVGEFPELQGLMGYYYALHDGEDEEVAVALTEQYMPRFAADDLPRTDLGVALSLADRLDTLLGIFAIGQKPSGVKDPFKLRRHALAVVRMLIASPAKLNASILIDEAFAGYGTSLAADKTVMLDLKFFILERLNSYYQNQNVPAELVWAVRAKQDEWFYDLDQRVNALKEFIRMPEASYLSAACKRVNNLLNHADNINFKELELDPSLFESDAEIALYEHVMQIAQKVEPMYRAANYTLILKELATLKEPVDVFFDQVMVMTDNLPLRTNRLALLQKLQRALQGVADIALLQLT